jgi:cathepsin L
MALAISTLLFLFFTVSSALDMSIFNHDDNHLSHDQSSWRSDDEVMSIYKWWLQKHGKAYNRLGEKAKRFEIFKNNLRFIDEHNSQNRTYKVGLTKFADLTNQEYRAMFLGTRSDPKRRLMKSKNPSERYAYKAGDKLPESVDWRGKGAVNPIKDQGSCGIIHNSFTFVS